MMNFFRQILKENFHRNHQNKGGPRLHSAKRVVGSKCANELHVRLGPIVQQQEALKSKTLPSSQDP
jgi:hypothetical protein